MPNLDSQFNNFLFYKDIFNPYDILNLAKIYFFYSLGISRNAFSPFTINLLVTSRCNLNCYMCSYSQVNKNGENLFTLSELENILNAVAGKKPIFFLSGGEPFVRADILEIARMIKKRSFRCIINTNGTLITEDQILQLSDMGLDAIIFSLYGLEEVHEGITGTPGSFKKTMRSIEFFSKNKGKTKIIISTTILPENYTQLPELIERVRAYSIDKIKIEHLNFLNGSETSAPPEDSMKNNIQPQTFLRGNEFDKAYGDKVAGILALLRRRYGKSLLIKPHLTDAEIKNWYSGKTCNRRGCFFVWHSLFINPDGQISPCQFLANCSIGNIKNSNISDIWQSAQYQSMRSFLRRNSFPTCNRCCKI